MSGTKTGHTLSKLSHTVGIESIKSSKSFASPIICDRGKPGIFGVPGVNFFVKGSIENIPTRTRLVEVEVRTGTTSLEICNGVCTRRLTQNVRKLTIDTTCDDKSPPPVESATIVVVFPRSNTAGMLPPSKNCQEPPRNKATPRALNRPIWTTPGCIPIGYAFVLAPLYQEKTSANS